jgi:hypothetical protein
MINLILARLIEMPFQRRRPAPFSLEPPLDLLNTLAVNELSTNDLPGNKPSTSPAA